MQATYEQWAQYAAQTGQDVQDILTYHVEVGPPVSSELPVSDMTDSEILALAYSRMDTQLEHRLDVLFDLQQDDALTPTDKRELHFLLRLHEVGQYHKAQGLAEAVNRSLISK